MAKFKVAKIGGEWVILFKMSNGRQYITTGPDMGWSQRDAFLVAVRAAKIYNGS